MNVLYLLLLIFSAISFGLAAFGATIRNINLVALGLMFFVLVPLIETLTSL